MIVNKINSNNVCKLNFGSKDYNAKSEKKYSSSASKTVLTGLGILGSIGLGFLLLKKGQGTKVLGEMKGAFVKTEDVANGKVEDAIKWENIGGGQDLNDYVSLPAAKKFIESATRRKAEILCDKLVRLRDNSCAVRVVTAKYPSGAIVSEGYMPIYNSKKLGGLALREIITPNMRAYHTISSSVLDSNYVIRNVDGSGIVKEVFKKPERVAKVVYKGYPTASQADGMTKIANPNLEL